MSDPGAWTRWGPPPDPPNSGLPAGKLAPARVMQLIDTGVRILRRHWKPLIAASALFGGIGLILGEVLSAQFSDMLASMFTVDATGRTTFNTIDVDTTRFSWAVGLSVAGSLVASAFLTLASVVASQYVDRDYRSGSITFRAALIHALRRAPVAILSSLLAALAVIGLMLAVVVIGLLAAGLFPAAGGGGLGVFLALIIAVAGTVAVVALGMRWSIGPVIVALEPVGPLAALRRSWHLTGDNTWRTFGLQALVVLTISLVTGLLAAILGAVLSPDLSTASPSHLGVQTGISVVLGVLTAPIVPVMLTVLYFDLRVRRDRFELSLHPQA